MHILYLYSIFFHVGGPRINLSTKSTSIPRKAHQWRMKGIVFKLINPKAIAEPGGRYTQAASVAAVKRKDIVSEIHNLFSPPPEISETQKAGKFRKRVIKVRRGFQLQLSYLRMSCLSSERKERKKRKKRKSSCCKSALPLTFQTFIDSDGCERRGITVRNMPSCFFSKS
ncbi:hypothetical protein CEXT_660171 [Caerostris extrusa]|uniref:Uncharacterized protein n=1 Tax=Caerostris extrusa TaxID=172846 RepID=A0AAV4N878_CAEEX|nr:hypothetical protein CEXT_660171 [Caerostris extrusa]